ncbi:hypothetical protein LTR84_006814 [Exophiala bonariae]|uniref:Nucleoside phosphorylase domain-containing protein n=1 Tax=Exophiala bonariae TaxID=1690606 RepID=A0AAV9N3R7_9EURO|nr:hypothetical protein LTR84_006814 [Exophiala bonariae]
MPSRLIEEYQVGWVCALPKELMAAQAMLDEEHEPFESALPNDNNSYVLGCIHGHNVVMACLPSGVIGNVSAATVGNNMLRTFPGIRIALLVGIGGGIPRLQDGVDIRLGDVVVSRPEGTNGGVVQYDLRNNLGNGLFTQRGILQPPPTLLLIALAMLEARHGLRGNQIMKTLSTVAVQYPRLFKRGFVHPGLEKDILFCGNIQGEQDCNHYPQCQDGVIYRQPREEQDPEVHYGVIASGNQLIKNASARDQLGREYGAKCVEMEAAGLMNEFPCIVIRGICDYADSHKNDVWQEYAAITAAAFAKELLSIVKPAEVHSAKHATEVLNRSAKYKLGLNLFDAPELVDNLFVGRQPEIRRMESILQPQSDKVGSSRKVLVLGGMGGIGKTQLAIFFAKQHRTEYSSVFWLNATSEVSLKMSMRKVAYRLLPPEVARKLDDEQIYIRVSNWLSEHDNAQWLVIFDNYDNPDEYSLMNYLPFVAHGSVIITTRQPDAVNGERLRVLSMREEGDGLRILATRSGRENVETDPGALRLALRLDGYPLALATAGAFLSQSTLSFGHYLQLYNGRWKVIASMGGLTDYATRTLYTTWNISFTRIKQQSLRAAHVLRFLAYLDYREIWFHLFSKGQVDPPSWFTEFTRDEFTFEDTMRVLTRYCLVEAHHQTGSYSLHTCVHDWTLDGLNEQIDKRQYWLAFDCIASNVVEADWNQFSELRYRRYTGHAVRLLHDRFQAVANQTESVTIRLSSVMALAELLRDQVLYDSAEQMYLRALECYEDVVGPDHSSTLLVVRSLANLYTGQGGSKLVSAEKMYFRVLQGFEAKLDSESVFNTLHSLGWLYFRQGKLEEAESHFIRALEGKEKKLGSEHLSTIETINRLCATYVDQGKLAKAENMYVQALQDLEKTVGPNHSSTLGMVNNLACLYADQDRVIEAEAMYTRVIKHEEKILGPDNISTLQTVNNLGFLYSDQGKLAEAEELYVRALRGFEKALGAEATLSYLPALETMIGFGDVYAQTDRKDLAKKMYTQALNGFAAVQGPSSKLCHQIEDRLRLLQLPTTEI